MSWRRRHRPSASCRPLRSRLGEFPVRGGGPFTPVSPPVIQSVNAASHSGCIHNSLSSASFAADEGIRTRTEWRAGRVGMCFLVSVCAAANAVVSASPRRRPPEPPRRQPRDGLRRPRTLQRRSRLVAGRLEPRPRRMVPSKAAGDSVMILHVRQVQVRSGSAPGAPVTDLSPQPDGPIWHTLGVDEVLAAEDVDPRRASTQPRSPRGLSASVRTDSRRARRSPGCMRSSVSSPTPCRSSCWWPELGASIR